MKDLYGKPGHLIRRLQQIAVALFLAETKDFDITPVQYAALIAIRENRDLDATRLSSAIAFDRSTLGSVLKRLEAKGWIERLGSDKDERIKVLRLTRKGAQLLNIVEPRVRKCQRRILAPLPSAERARFMRMLSRLVHLNNDFSRAPLRAATRLEPKARKSPKGRRRS
jgi:DNA-binding MarR family transcriptional regulator